jgi:hypothetical protein
MSARWWEHWRPSPTGRPSAGRSSAGRSILRLAVARRLVEVRPPSPFAALRLDPAEQLTDDDVRAAWRRIATATHPDRADGGDPAAFASAAAAYTDLRTATGRGEARAALAPRRRPAGRPARLLLRLAVATVTCVLVVLVAPGPAAAGLVVGAATWLALTTRRDLLG